MADYLTKRTKFFCTVSPVVSFTISASGKVTHKGSTVLTTAAKLSGSGTCAPLTAAAQGTPKSCRFQQTPWINFDFTHKANSENLLTANSCCMCPVCPGGTIKVQMANARNFKQGMFTAPPVVIPKSSPEKISSKSVAPDKNSDVAPKNFSEDKQENKRSSQKVSGVSESISSSEVKADEVILRCKSCTRQNCKYRLEQFGEFSAVVDNNSAKLRKNYEEFLAARKNLTSADENYLCSLEFNGSWSYAAHHVISGNQVFKQVPRVAEVAQACGYDINCAENCIMLPSRREGHGNLSDVSKSASAFDVMSITGIQWHVGGHSYSFQADELAEIKRQIELRTGRAGKVKNYAELLIEELRKIDKTIGKSICPARIITALSNLSSRVREKLAAFKEKPWASYPYYVSREAYMFAFKVPRLRKFIAVGKDDDNKVLLKLFKTVGAGNDFELKESLATNDAREIIIFCGNVQHFVFLSGVEESILPFVPEFKRSIDDFTYNQVAETVAWLHANPVQTYVAPLRKITDRLKALEVGK